MWFLVCLLMDRFVVFFPRVFYCFSFCYSFCSVLLLIISLDFSLCLIFAVLWMKVHMNKTFIWTHFRTIGLWISMDAPHYLNVFLIPFISVLCLYMLIFPPCLSLSIYSFILFYSCYFPLTHCRKILKPFVLTVHTLFFFSLYYLFIYISIRRAYEIYALFN